MTAKMDMQASFICMFAQALPRDFYPRKAAVKAPFLASFALKDIAPYGFVRGCPGLTTIDYLAMIRLPRAKGADLSTAPVQIWPAG